MSTTCDIAKYGDQDEVWALLKQPMLTEKQFRVLHGECVGKSVNPELARFWIMRAIARGDEVSRWYWISDYPLEKDMMDCLESIQQGPSARQHQDALLRHVRRFLLTRYAFSRVRAVNNMIRAHMVGEGALEYYPSLVWLWKDLFLPRIALSLFIGYAALLGAGPMADWLRIAASRALSGWSISSILLVLIVFLVYLSVRTRIGSANARALVNRTIWISVGCLTWAGVAAMLQNVGQWMLFGQNTWTLTAELLTAEAALFISLLGQFFFGKSGSGSISEPL